MTERIRVVIVDDHLMVRRGLATFLKAAQDLELVGEAATGPEAIRVCAETRPDVVLMDLKLPELDAIRAAAVGRATLGPEATQALVRQTTAPPIPRQALTEREREVLALMVKGLSNADIADRLVLSRSTVNFHVSNVLGKLEVTSRTAA